MERHFQIKKKISVEWYGFYSERLVMLLLYIDRFLNLACLFVFNKRQNG